MIDHLTVSKILDAARIEEVVGDFVTLKRAGANYKGLCPFHDDRTPSFMVSPSKNYCKCFACGKGGSPVGFIMEHEQISFPEALRWLAKKYGITIEEKELTAEEKQSRDERESMNIVNEWALNWFKKQLRESEEGRSIGMAYFRNRGFRDDIIEKFQLGYCPSGRETSLWKDALKAGYQEKYLVCDPDTKIGTGLCTKNENGLHDRYWGRVMFPIFAANGKVVGFGGRVLDAATKGVAVKYQNSPESLVYDKKRELYGLFQAKQAIQKQNCCFLVEGYTDVMAMHQSGIENVVASSGTALTTEQIRLIHRFTKNIVVIYDGDAAGIKASQRGIDMLLEQDMDVKLLLLPDGDDPDSFARKHNAKEYQEYMATHQVDFIDFKTNLLMKEAEGDPIKMSELAENIVQSIACIPNEIKRSLYIQKTCQKIKLEERLIASAVTARLSKKAEERLRIQDRLEMQMGQQVEQTYSVSDANTANIQNVLRPNVKSREVLFLKKEREIVRAIVRHGEQIMCMLETDDGNKPLTVIEYISLILQENKLTLQNPLDVFVFEETLKRKDEEGFRAELYFLNNPNPEVSLLAFNSITDEVELSSIFTNSKDTAETVETDVADLVVHLMSDYLLAVIKNQLDDAQKRLQDPSVNNNMAVAMEVMKEIKELKEKLTALSRQRGDRVIS